MSLFPTPQKVSNNLRPDIPLNEQLKSTEWNDLVTGINNFYEEFQNFIQAGVTSQYLEQVFNNEDTVVVTHNYGADPVPLVVIDGEMFIPKNVVFANDKNSFTVTFNSPKTGKVIATIGNPSLIEVPKPDNEIVVNSLADLPNPVGGLITLEDEKVYRISGEINLGNNELQTGQNTTIRGNSPVLDYITSDTGNFLINSSSSFRMFEVGFRANNGSIFNLNGNGSQICLMFGVRFFGTGGLGNVSNYGLFEVSTGLFVGYTSTLNFFGGNNGSFIFNDVSLVDSNGITSIDFGISEFDIIKFSACDFTIADNGTGINVAADSANIASGGIGLINGTNFNVSGGVNTGVSISGYSPKDERWSISQENSNITASDRIDPRGWAYYSDDASSTEVYGTTPTRMTINNLGLAANSDFLPKVIRGIDELWDVNNNQIKPISVGDSYTIGINMQTTALSSNPTRIDMILDIGSDPNTPTIPIITVPYTLKNVASQPLSFTFPVFSLITFLNNGGKIFFQVNSGTVTVSNRNIFIRRETSGNS